MLGRIGGRGSDLIDDDGRTLWASPTHGPPLDLAYLPPGVEIILAVRPAELLAHAEGRRLSRRWDRWGKAIELVAAATGTKFDANRTVARRLANDLRDGSIRSHTGRDYQIRRSNSARRCITQPTDGEGRVTDHLFDSAKRLPKCASSRARRRRSRDDLERLVVAARDADRAT